MTATRTTILDASGQWWASSKPATERTLGRLDGVVAVEANPLAQTAKVTYDSTLTSVPELAGWLRDCGLHCQGRSVPAHTCDPMADGHEASVAHAAADADDSHELSVHQGHVVPAASPHGSAPPNGGPPSPHPLPTT